MFFFIHNKNDVLAIIHISCKVLNHETHQMPIWRSEVRQGPHGYSPIRAIQLMGGIGFAGKGKHW